MYQRTAGRAGLQMPGMPTFKARRVEDLHNQCDKDGYKGVMASVNPYVSAGKYQPFECKTELVPGITALPTIPPTPIRLSTPR
jgi:hypothetical protein